MEFSVFYMVKIGDGLIYKSFSIKCNSTLLEVNRSIVEQYLYAWSRLAIYSANIDLQKAVKSLIF